MKKFISLKGSAGSSPIKKFFYSLLPFILIVAVFTGFVFYVVNFTGQQALKDILGEVEPPFLFVNLLLIVIFSTLNFTTIKNKFKNIKLSTWIFLIMIFVLAFSIRMYITPHTHRVYFDEDIYLDIGKEIFLRGKGLLCNYGDSKGCYEYDFMKWPNGYPLLLTVPYAAFGINEAIVYDFVAFLGSLSVVLIFFIAYLLSKNERISLYAALFLALASIPIMWSGTTASEPVFMFFTLLAFFFLALSLESNSLKIAALALFALAYAMQIKAEGVFLLPVALLMILFLDKNWAKKFRSYKFLSLWIIFFIFIAPYLIHVRLAEKIDTWGAEGSKFGLEYTKRNIPENFIFWINGYPTIEHSILITAFALFGLCYYFGKNKNTLLFISAWFMIFFLLYGFFYAGSVRYGVDVRYTLTQYPPLILLAGYGVDGLSKVFSRKGIKHLFDIGLVAVILVSFYLFYLPSIATPADQIREAYGARHYHDFAVNETKNLDSSCYILSHVPSIYLVMDMGSLQTWNGQNQQRMDELFKKTNCVVFDDGYWCTLPPYKESVCKNIFENFKLSEINHFQDTIEQRNYTFYRVSQK
jgi:4-amino-4-deoxy-L-arabinose transferase-like glycosyltransferase